MNHPTLIATLAGLLFATTASAQTTWWVDASNPNCPGSGTESDPFCLIQDGISAASDSDEVLVRPGHYLENLAFLGKAICVRSDVDGISGSHDIDAAQTIIDGNAQGSALDFRSSEGSDSVIEGFTITGGSGTDVGGGGTSGGGIVCVGSSPTITRNHIVGNTATVGGGGLFVQGGSPSILFNLISSNITDIDGGGMRVLDSGALIHGNCITNNRSDFGGGIASLNAPPQTISCNVIHANVAIQRGGGVYCLAGQNSILLNNSIVANQAPDGGGLYSGRSSTPLVKNSILWGNSPHQVSGSATITYCDVEGGIAGTGNIDADPLFLDPANGDFHLQPASPCLDAGDEDGSGLPGDDKDGEPRVQDGDGDCRPVVDIGAHEAPDVGGDELVLTASPSVVQAGDTLTFEVSCGAANRPVLLFIWDVNGTPYLQHIWTASFDVSGGWTQDFGVPGGLPPSTVGFLAIGFAIGDVLDLSNVATVTLQ